MTTSVFVSMEFLKFARKLGPGAGASGELETWIPKGAGGRAPGPSPGPEPGPQSRDRAPAPGAARTPPPSEMGGQPYYFKLLKSTKLLSYMVSANFAQENVHNVTQNH